MLFLDFDEYLATPSNYPTLIRMRAFESSSWDELNGGHVSIIKDRQSKNIEITKNTENTKDTKNQEKQI